MYNLHQDLHQKIYTETKYCHMHWSRDISRNMTHEPKENKNGKNYENWIRMHGKRNLQFRPGNSSSKIKTYGHKF